MKKYERVYLSDFTMSDLIKRIDQDYENYHIAYINRARVGDEQNTIVECVLEKEIDTIIPPYETC